MAHPVAATQGVIEDALPVGGMVVPRHNLSALVMAERPGTVAKLCVRTGQQVAAGQAIALLAYDPLPGERPASPPPPASASPPQQGEPQFHLQPAGQGETAQPLAPAAAPAPAPPALVPPPAPSPLVSPIAGVVTRIWPREGQRVDPEFPVVAAVMDTRQVELVAQVPAAAAGTEGKRVVLSPAGGGRLVRGRVQQVSRGEGSQTLMTVLIPNPAGRLKAGMVLRGKVWLGPDRQAVMVPWRAVCRDGARRCLLVIAADGQVQTRPVVLGGKHGYLVEVISGVQPGERVLVVGNYHPRPR